MKRLIYILLLVSFFKAPLHAVNPEITIPLRFDRYYNYDDVVEALKALNKAYPEFTKLEVVGTSEEDLKIYSLVINNPATGEALSKPGVYVDGNIHGNEIQAGEVCLYYANMLLTKYAENKKIRAVVDKNAHYIIPVVNVDGRAHFFMDANTPNSNRSIRVPRDDDRDGLFDEDSADDLDQDGSICQMRIKDPFGKYKTDPEDERLMIPVKPGEQGEWTILGLEGIDNDNDGKINEDSEGYLDPNRNWGFNWRPTYVQTGAGEYPFSGKGLKSIAEYIHQHPNIIIAFAFHNTGGMWLRTPSDEEEMLDPSDIAVYDVMGKNAIKMTPGYVYMPSYQLYPTYGDFDAHVFSLEGAYSFVGELFMRSQETYRDDVKKQEKEEESPMRGGTPAQNREYLKFNDHLGLNELYKEWKPFKHPVYGDIEIGGWVKMSSRLPHPFMLPELVHRSASVVLFSAEQTPEISMEEPNVKKIGKDLYQVRVRLVNKKAIPSMSAQSVKNKLYPKDILQLKGAEVVAAGQITDLLNNKVSYKEYKPEIQFITVPGNNKVDYQFLVKGKGNIVIEYMSKKAGNLKKEFKL